MLSEEKLMLHSRKHALPSQFCVFHFQPVVLENIKNIMGMLKIGFLVFTPDFLS